ncbi:MAG TPA: HAD-IA family hydrolase [Candidatus Binatia bacterium]|nr:HAD-IA family hydrolase [Candidatus Binatia bacterium]
MTIEAVLFDAAGTLIKTARSVGESYAALAQKYGLEVAPAELAPRFRDSFERFAPLAFPEAKTSTVQALERAWWKKVVQQVFSPFGPFAEFDSYFEELFAYFAQAGSWVPYPEVRETLSALRERGVRLAVVSNFDSRLIAILEGLDLASLFDRIFVSSSVGYAKPDPRIFEFVLNAQRLAPEKVLHVGDSVSNDIVGATAAGIKGILVDRKGTHEHGAVQRIGSLRELLDNFD